MEVLPRAIREAVFSVFGEPLKCYVLSDGQRVIDAASAERLFEVMDDLLPGDDEVDAALASFYAWVHGADCQ